MQFLTIVFYRCTKLKHFDFSAIKKVGRYAFRESGLQEVCLPKNIEILECGTFSRCNGLRSVTWNCKCNAIPAHCFSECPNLTQFDFSSIKEIGRYAFWRSGLQEVRLPKNIESIYERAFGECSKLQSVKWNCKCDAIPANCFSECSNLTSFNFAGIKKIGSYAFWASGLQEVRLPKKIECISDEAFSGCSELHSVTWNCTCDVIPANCFFECSKLTNFDFSGIKKIEQDAFWKSGLISVTLSKGTAVGQSCFAFCDSLAKVEWLSDRSIRGDIFADCKNIKEIFISDKVKNIEVSAFASSPNAEISFI